ncbi:hypothetical protein G5B40_00660 [Pikeienuella piscinae]|uniref:Uncharacterized protein n=1 Tax=Pikeienuella piscinae TaxID=2748098 RepID=A0A7L5BSU3_9RHOB|nr:hypothetical protein [Pikeienuella piscinae]QIE54082.1 hypothetical protein G5B40_00660 [Pikeienuella piscinae]
MRDRPIAPVFSAAAARLRDGVAVNADMVYAAGETLQSLKAKHGERFRPDPGVDRLRARA